MRTFIVTSTDNFLHNEYITAGIEYTLNAITETVYFCRAHGPISCSFMKTHKFKRALREGVIKFTDTNSSSSGSHGSVPAALANPTDKVCAYAQ